VRPVTTLGCREALGIAQNLFPKQGASLGIFSFKGVWIPHGHRRTLCGDESARAIVFRGLVNYRGKRTSFGCPNRFRNSRVVNDSELLVEQRLRLNALDTLPVRRHGCLLSEQRHARRDQLPSPAPACGAGSSNRWLARVLAGRLGPKADLRCRDGVESKKLKTGMLAIDQHQPETARPETRGEAKPSPVTSRGRGQKVKRLLV
jgi:hypothetical protein